MVKVTKSFPDRESEFEIVIRVAIGAGESSAIQSALMWSIVDRRGDEESTPQLDLYWDSGTVQACSAIENGHRAEMLLATRKALAESRWEWPRGSRQEREISLAVSILDRALEHLGDAMGRLGQ